VRELINITGELALLSRSGGVARKRDLPPVIRNFKLSEPRDTDPFVRRGAGGSETSDTAPGGNGDLRRRLELALGKHGGNKTAAARELGIGRSTLYRKLTELGLG